MESRPVGAFSNIPITRRAMEGYPPTQLTRQKAQSLKDIIHEFGLITSVSF
jgi:hypothetical protein